MTIGEELPPKADAAHAAKAKGAGRAHPASEGA